MSNTPECPDWMGGRTKGCATPPPSGVNVSTGAASAVPMFWMTIVADRPMPAAFFDVYGA